MATETVLFGVARHFLSQAWLPSLIAGLPKLTWPDEPQHMVSHESIHTYICSAVGTPLEHSSRPVTLIRQADATAALALDGFTAKQRRTVQPMYQSLTEAQDKQRARRAERRSALAWGCASATCAPLAMRFLRKHQGTDPSIPTQGH